MKTLGYFFGLSSESITEALNYYSLDMLNESLAEVKLEIKQAKKDKNIGKTAKPKIYKLVVMEVEE
jgi:hypothetical protein